MEHHYLFPESYSHWLSSRLPHAPVETLASCDHCAMVNPEGIRRDPGPFLPQLKCCTYFPFIPNFTLGKLPAKKLKMLMSLESGILLPLGLFPAVGHQRKIQNFGPKAFGNESQLLCPFMDQALDKCSIWNFRPGVCTSYFCKSNRGRDGLQFWGVVEKYLNKFEFILSKEIISRMKLDENTFAYSQSCLAADTEEEERTYFYQAAWGIWLHRHEGFYEKCSEIAFGVSDDEIGNLFDSEMLELEAKIKSY